MYRRYAPMQVNTKTQTETPRRTETKNTDCRQPGNNGIHNSCQPLPKSSGKQNCSHNRKPAGAAKSKQDKKTSRNPVSGLIPPALYNPETKKVLGMFSAEDLLLAALIIILLDNDDNDDPMLIYALIYILISDYVDLPF